MSRRTTSSPWLSESISQWLIERKEVHSFAAQTIASNTTDIAQFRAFICAGLPAGADGLPDRRVDSIDASAINAYLRGMNAHLEPGGDHYTPNTWNGKLTATRVYLKWAKEMAHYDPYLPLPISGLRNKPKRARKFSRPAAAIWEDMLDSCADDGRARFMVASAGFTAARFASELSPLRVGDARHVLESQQFDIFQIKTQHDVSIPLVSEYEYEIRKYLAYYEERMEFQGTPIRDEHFLFPSRRKMDGSGGHGFILANQTLARPERQLKPVLARFGLDKKGEGAHTFRRALGLALYNECVRRSLLDQDHPDKISDIEPIEIVRTWFGHASAAVTRSYIGVEADAEKVMDHFRGKPLFVHTGKPFTTVDAAAIASIEKSKHHLSLVRDVG